MLHEIVFKSLYCYNEKKIDFFALSVLTRPTPLHFCSEREKSLLQIRYMKTENFAYQQYCARHRYRLQFPNVHECSIMTGLFPGDTANNCAHPPTL